MRTFPTLLLLISLGLLGACGQQASSDNAPAPSANSATAEDTDTPKLPDWFRSEFPRYPGAEPSQISYDREYAPDTLQFAYSVGKADGDKVTATFKQLYSENGWTIADEYGAHRFSAKKAGGYSAVIGITATKWVTIVSVTARRPHTPG